jgi:L-lactate dehydrogenase complex protein LldG
MKNKAIIDEFTNAAKVAAATVEVIKKDASAINDALIKSTENEELVLFAEPNNLDANLFSDFKSNKKVVTDPTTEQLKTIRCGVTDAFGAVKSTGSVCVEVSKGLAIPASMLTRKHIVLVDANTIVPRPRDVLSEEYLEGKGLSQSFSFITGSSATADMGPLVRGVHGPGQLHIIILE